MGMKLFKKSSNGATIIRSGDVIYMMDAIIMVICMLDVLTYFCIEDSYNPFQ